MTRLDAFKHGWFDYRRKRFWAWVALALYALLGFVIAPWIARGVIVDQVHEQLGLTATLEDVDINPFALTARLEKFSMADHGGERLVAFDSFGLNLQLASILNRAWTLREIRLVHPFVRVERNAHGELNLAALIPPTEPVAEVAQPSSPLRMIISNVVLDGGRVAIVDLAAREPYATELGPVDLKVKNLSTLPNQAGEQRIVLQTAHGGRIDWSGSLTLEPLQSNGHVTIAGEALAKLSAYLPAELALSIVDGSVNVAFDYRFARQDDVVSANVDNLTVALKDLGLAQRGDGGADLLRLGGFAVEGGQIAWPERTVSVQRVAFTRPQVTVSRDAQQRFSWETLWQGATSGDAIMATAGPAQTNASSEAPASGVPTNLAVSEPVLPGPPAAGPVAAAQPWSVQVARFELLEGAIGFTDQSVTPAATLGINSLGVSLDGFTLAPDAAMPFTLNFNVDGGGAAALSGTLTAFPAVRVDTKVAVTALALAAINPYLNVGTYLQIGSGAIGVDAHVVSNPDETFGLDGQVHLVDLQVKRDGTEGRFVDLKRLDLKGITLSNTHRRVDIARADIDGAYVRVDISKDRVVNLANVTREVDAPAPAAAAAAPPEAPWTIKLGRLKIRHSDADFSDESLPVPFSRSITALTGGINTLDTASRAATQLNLEGQVGEFGQLDVSGTLRVFDPLADTDITARFKNIELPAASPYAIRFAGHKVASGKLDLDLHYLLRKGILDGKHKIVLRDFALGEKVDYPDALDLPYDLAISLLKDGSGNIDIDLPVEGDVNDPTFRIGGVIMKALGNLITKIITAPFSLLGRLVGLGDSENLDQIYFVPGRADLTPPEREKVGKVAEALVLRPNLALTVHGVMATQVDAHALQEAALRARLEERVGDADSAGRLKVVQAMVEESIPDLALEPLRVQFTRAPVPGAEIAFDETAYLNALIEKLIDAEPLEADAVDALALARASAVRDALVTNASLDAARITDAASLQVEPTNDGSVPLRLELATP